MGWGRPCRQSEEPKTIGMIAITAEGACLPDVDAGLVLVAPVVVAELTGTCGHAYTDAAYLCLEYWGAEQQWELHYRRLGS